MSKSGLHPLRLAAGWLLANDHEIPDELAAAAEDCSE